MKKTPEDALLTAEQDRKILRALDRGLDPQYAEILQRIRNDAKTVKVGRFNSDGDFHGKNESKSVWTYLKDIKLEAATRAFAETEILATEGKAFAIATLRDLVVNVSNADLLKADRITKKLARSAREENPAAYDQFEQFRFFYPRLESLLRDITSRLGQRDESGPNIVDWSSNSFCLICHKYRTWKHCPTHGDDVRLCLQEHNVKRSKYCREHVAKDSARSTKQWLRRKALRLSGKNMKTEDAVDYLTRWSRSHPHYQALCSETWAAIGVVNCDSWETDGAVQQFQQVARVFRKFRHTESVFNRLITDDITPNALKRRMMEISLGNDDCVEELYKLDMTMTPTECLEVLLRRSQFELIRKGPINHTLPDPNEPYMVDYCAIRKSLEGDDNS